MKNNLLERELAKQEKLMGLVEQGIIGMLVLGLVGMFLFLAASFFM